MFYNPPAALSRANASYQSQNLQFADVGFYLTLRHVNGFGYLSGGHLRIGNHHFNDLSLRFIYTEVIFKIAVFCRFVVVPDNDFSEPRYPYPIRLIYYDCSPVDVPI